MHGMIDLQHDDPALNDAVMRRFPEATAPVDTCAVSSLGHDLVAQAHQEGSLDPSFTGEDLFCLRWMAGTANRESTGPIRMATRTDALTRIRLEHPRPLNRRLPTGRHPPAYDQ
ncbi:hypothetical protein [Streptomyces cyaneofuscatus]|uniref:hypothetical protein n=1 Tax=Streptomyces cyaneofuscatus TaxID=66883 RepID=UPI00339DEDA1